MGPSCFSYPSTDGQGSNMGVNFYLTTPAFRNQVQPIDVFKVVNGLTEDKAILSAGCVVCSFSFSFLFIF